MNIFEKEKALRELKPDLNNNTNPMYYTSETNDTVTIYNSDFEELCVNSKKQTMFIAPPLSFVFKNSNLVVKYKSTQDSKTIFLDREYEKFKLIDSSGNEVSNLNCFSYTASDISYKGLDATLFVLSEYNLETYDKELIAEFLTKNCEYIKNTSQETAEMISYLQNKKNTVDEYHQLEERIEELSTVIDELTLTELCKAYKNETGKDYEMSVTELRELQFNIDFRWAKKNQWKDI